MLIYDTDRVQVHQADARDVLVGLPTNSVDLILTDPPYGVEWQSGRRAEAFENLIGDTPADRAGIRDVIAEGLRALKVNRHLYVFGPDDVLDGLKVSAPASLVWDKARTGTGDLAAPWGPAHEPISFFVSKHSHAGDTGKENGPVRMRKGSVLRFYPPTGRNVRHPSEKPLGLLRELLESSTRQDETILDPFGGVGSTAVAAILAGRRAIVSELDPRYVEITVERVKRAEDLYRKALSC